MYDRIVRSRVEEALTDTPVVLVVGPRRAGKTTLVRATGGENRAYHTLDDRTTLDSAEADPVGFVRGLDRAVIDEIQRVPELLLAIKRSVDEDYRPGRFLLTGSANVLTLSRVADSLAGRMETIRLLPLAKAEVLGVASSFIDRLFSGRATAPENPLVGGDLVEIVLSGGFPEALTRSSERRRLDWGRAYLDSVLTRDLRDIADVERLTDFPRFVRILSRHAGRLVNYSSLGAGIGITYKTAQRYVELLERIFLVHTLKPWHSNRVKSLVKTPKLHFIDSGLLAAAGGFSHDQLRSRREEYGHLLESFVFAELLKLLSGSERRFDIRHFRDHEKNEVDLVIERDDGRIAGVEVKAGATVSPADLSGLHKLADATADRFAFGALLYDGETVVPYGAKHAAVPISCLWSS